MPHINLKRRPATEATRATVAVLVLLLACLGLAACGESSKGSSTNTNVAAATSAAGATGAGPTRPGAGRFRALRECLQKNGIALPKRTPGQRRPGGAGGFLNPGAGGPRLPPGVTRGQYEAAVKKCGGAPFIGGGAPIRSPAVKQALAKFAACMRENGVKVPEPSTSGGPIFNSKGLNTASAQFKAASAKCNVDLPGVFRRGAGGGGAP
jgi:hypothetical protein